MKRSEMVKILADTMVTRRREDAMAEADFTLRLLERNGMLPPYNDNHGVSNYDLAMGRAVEATHNWESEDGN